jgi:microsomal epoxide hydrolase
MAVLMTQVQSFKIDVPDVQLQELRQRLRQTRWPDQVQEVGWSQGTDIGFLKELVAIWQDSYDWRAAERRINAFDHRIAQIQGCDLHFVHRPAVGGPGIPLLLGHGCFSSFYEFHRVIDELADPAAHGRDPATAFDVVAVSWPGFGFSGKPLDRGMGTARMGAMAHELMTRVLGYEKFGAAGGSWGSLVATSMAYTHPESMLGIFLTQACPPAHPATVTPADELTDAEKKFIAAMQEFRLEEVGYAQLLQTRPQSLGYALNDSPAGLAGWVCEKIRRWTDCAGDIGSTIPLDDILTGLSITWFSESVASSQRLYYEAAHGDWTLPPGERIEVPTGVLGLPGGIPHETVPEETIRRVFNLRQYAMAPRGGHYPALEVPEIFIDQVRSFFSALRPSAA